MSDIPELDVGKITEDYKAILKGLEDFAAKKITLADYGVIVSNALVQQYQDGMYWARMMHEKHGIK